MIRGFGFLSSWWRSFAQSALASSTSDVKTGPANDALLPDVSRRAFLGGLSAVVLVTRLPALVPTEQTESLTIIFKARPMSFTAMARGKSYRDIDMFLAPPLHSIDFHPRENYRIHARRQNLVISGRSGTSGADPSPA
jgi:hypothetical protein